MWATSRGQVTLRPVQREAIGIWLVGAPITPLKKSLPFAYRLQRAIFGQWEEIDDRQVPCPHCGSFLVARKENTPRSKKYRHPETGEWCQVAKDNRPVKGRELDIRGKCPLELAGYDISQSLSPASCTGSCWAGRLKPSASLSQMRNAPQMLASRKMQTVL